jgi:rhomboid protease GluP
VSDGGLQALAGPLPARLAGDVGLLLTAEGLEVTLAPADGGVVVLVPAAAVAHARRIVAEEYPAGLEAAAARARTPGATPAPAAPAHWFGRGSWVVLAIAAVCVGVFLAEERAGGSEDPRVLLQFGASRPAHLRNGEWWRLATALFVHVGPRHLLGNLAALLLVAPALADALGGLRFALVYAAAGLAGNWLSAWFRPADVISAGASGAILGVLGALAGQRLRFSTSARYRGWQVIAALLATLGLMAGAEPGVDHLAHFGGLAAGFALGLLLPPAPATATRRA